MKVSQRASIVIAIGVLAAAFIFAPANVAGASVPTNGRIAFASARFPADVSGPDIYTMDPNGTNVIGPLTPGFADPFRSSGWHTDAWQAASVSPMSMLRHRRTHRLECDGALTRTAGRFG